jgi:two-component system phosphate regulon response regulator PhoB
MNALTLTTRDAPQRLRILVVADQNEAVEVLFTCAREECFEIYSVGDMETGLTRIQTEWPSLIILDLQDRAQVARLCHAVRADQGTQRIPIIIVTAENQTRDRIAGLESGADDCVGKPFNPRELVLRVKAVLRRGTRLVSEELFVRGPITMDPARCHVAVDNRRIHLTTVEFKLLRTLVKQPGEVQSRETLLHEARGNGESLASRTIDTHIRRLRRKLGKAAHLVETVRGSGYRLRPT